MANLVIPQRNYIKKIRRYLIMILVLLVLTGYHCFTQYRKLAQAQDALMKEQDLLIALQGGVNQSSKDYVKTKKAFDQKFASILSALQKVFPGGENYTDLARAFDNTSDLKFGISRIDPKQDYAVLPLTLNVSGTQEDFLQFLKLIEHSGELEDRTRLMEVRSISINFDQQSGDGTPQKPLLTVAIALNAFFQKPLN
jgi:hypothetical protein